MKKVLSDISFYFLRGFLFILGKMPLELHYFNAIWISALIRKVFRYRVPLVEENLSYAFPEKSEEQRRQILKDFYRHFAEVFVEAIWFGSCTDRKRVVKSHIVELGDMTQMGEALQKAPGAMVMCTHAGNWELQGGIELFDPDYGANPVKGEHFCMVYRRLSSALWDRVMKDNRCTPTKKIHNQEGYIESQSMVRYVITHQDRAKMYNIITDQRPYFSAPSFIRVKFMNRECNTMSAAATLAVKMSMPVFFAHMLRKPGFGYTLDYEMICPDASAMDAGQIMKRYYELLEADIRKQPENYLWTHNRWWVG